MIAREESQFRIRILWTACKLLDLQMEMPWQMALQEGAHVNQIFYGLLAEFCIRDSVLYSEYRIQPIVYYLSRLSKFCAREWTMENRRNFAGAKFGGESEIRTHGSISTTHAFQACALNHSATSPLYGTFWKPNS